LAEQHSAGERLPTTIGGFVFAVGRAAGAIAEPEAIMQAGQQRFRYSPILTDRVPDN
jgi:hypothetical protein